MLLHTGMRKETITLIYKNIHPSFFNYELVEMVGEEWESQETSKIYTMLRYDIFREPFFVLPPRGWYRADLKHLIIFIPYSFRGHTCLASLVHLDFSLTLNPGPSVPTRRVNAQNDETSCLSALYPLLRQLRVENFRCYIFIGTHTHLVGTLLSASHLRNSRDISAVFFLH